MMMIMMMKENGRSGDTCLPVQELVVLLLMATAPAAASLKQQQQADQGQGQSQELRAAAQATGSTQPPVLPALRIWRVR
jgi:ABC-type phosphate transport system substrate-binding protein